MITTAMSCELSNTNSCIKFVPQSSPALNFESQSFLNKKNVFLIRRMTTCKENPTHLNKKSAGLSLFQLDDMSKPQSVNDILYRHDCYPF